MCRHGLIRWGLATVVFLAIGGLDMRYGHRTGLALLLLFLMLVFALDTRERRRPDVSPTVDAPPNRSP